MKGLLYYLLGIITGAAGYYVYDKYYKSKVSYDGAMYDEYMAKRKEEQSNGGEYEAYTANQNTTSYNSATQNYEPPKYSTNEPVQPTFTYTEEQLERAAEKEATDMQSWANSHMNDAPEILTPAEAGDLPPHVVTKTLSYYHDDFTLVDDETGEFVDQEQKVGDCLEQWDDYYRGTFVNSKKPQLYVINYHEGVLYDIHRIMGAYYDGNTGG